MRILQVVPSLAASDGGPSEVAFRLSENLVNAGASVDLAFTRARDEETEYLASAGRLRSDRFHEHSFPRLTNGSTKYSRAFGSWVRANCRNFDVVHVHAVFSYPSIAAAKAARSASVPYAIRPAGALTRWSLSQRPLRKYLALRAMIESLVRNSSVVHCTSDTEASDIKDRFPGVTTVVIANGVDDRLFEVEPSPSRTITFIGRLHSKKRVDLLIHSFIRSRAREQGWVLVIAGDGPPREVNALKRLAAGFAAQISFTGWVSGDQKLELLKRSALFALPSLDENFGVAAAEALAAGVPVVATKGVAIINSVEECGAGVNAGDTAADFAAGIDTLALDDGFRRSASRAARKLAFEEFRWSVVSEKVCALYKEILHQ